MIFSRYFKFIIFLFLFVFTTPIFTAETVDEKVKQLTLELRCMTCQNQSIYDSEADFSKEIKELVRSKINEGKTDKEIKKFLADRYGEYILFKPMFDYKNLFLWGFPFILLTIGLIFIVLRSRKNSFF